MGADDLMVEAFAEAVADAGIEPQADRGGMARQRARRHQRRQLAPCRWRRRCACASIPVTRVENMCATGTEALRGAVYAVAARRGRHRAGARRGEAQGHRLRRPAAAHTRVSPTTCGCPTARRPATSPSSPAPISPATASTGAGSQAGDGARLVEEPRRTASQTPRRTCARPIDMETILGAPMIADPLGLFDCCGVSDGAACAIVTTPEIARGARQEGPRHGQGDSAGASNGWEAQFGAWDGSYVRNTTRSAARRAYEEAGIADPRARDRPDRSARLLLDHRARDHGGSRPVRGGPRLHRHPGRQRSTATARCRARSTAG